MLTNSGVNKVILVGRIAKEPCNSSASNEPLMQCFQLVTQEFIKKNGENQEHNEWHQVKVPAGVNDERYALKKGDLVYIQGKVETRKYIDEQNIKRYVTEIIANSLQVLSPAQAQELLMLQSA
ncbi:single-stranded DNA-binding protein [Mucilaginibacter sp. RS28]|uniref:Single-stranded DNA-binding protein n=1 Tax=Mucilaginibacter straminoryzae TaxID=2932774 RepID=A0A9X1X5M8_9SPHI|nr:single-stranded DNA-binding protein [Mucilaginibacter straminoryzae]MCJ8211494.1 single-stranded DNA-binding protein [Mucilaginibacter straminoryzae]